MGQSDRLEIVNRPPELPNRHAVREVTSHGPENVASVEGARRGRTPPPLLIELNGLYATAETVCRGEQQTVVWSDKQIAAASEKRNGSPRRAYPRVHHGKVDGARGEHLDS